MRRKILLWIGGVLAVSIAVLIYLVLTGERGLSLRSKPLRSIDVTRLSDNKTTDLGWKPRGLDAVFDYAATLSSDNLVIVTRSKTVGAFGDLKRPLATHSVRKAIVSALVGQHIGFQPNQIRLNATLSELSIDDAPLPLSDLQKQATVEHLLKSKSGINHPASAEGGLTKEKDKRLGKGENKPGLIWAYNNWDYNALTSILEARTGLSVAEAFRDGIAVPVGMKDFKLGAVSYISDPKRSQHRAAAFRVSARDLVKFGQLYLNKGSASGQRILPASWVGRITQGYAETGRDDLRWGHGYLWWLPSPKTSLPKGTFWAWGLSNQAVFVIPAWDTVIVHQADTTEFIKRFIPLISTNKNGGESAIEEMILACRKRSARKSKYCIEHRFVTRREFAKLISLIVAARR